MERLGVQYDQVCLLAFKRCYCAWALKLLLPDQNISGPYPIYVNVNFKWNPSVRSLKWKSLSSAFMWHWRFIMMYKMLQTFSLRKKPSCVTIKHDLLIITNTVYLYALQCFSDILRFVDEPECVISDIYWAGPSFS